MAQEYKVLTFLPTATDIHNHTDRQKVKSIGAWESPWIDPCRGFDVISPSLLLRFTAASRSVALIFCWLFSYSYGGLASFFARNLFSSWRQTCHYSKLSNLFHSFSLVRRQTDFALRVRLNWQRLPSHSGVLSSDIWFFMLPWFLPQEHLCVCSEKKVPRFFKAVTICAGLQIRCC